MDNIRDLTKKLRVSDNQFNKNFKDKTIIITTEDNNLINFIITKPRLPHLLGINSEYYKRWFGSYKNMYQFFQSLIMDSKYYERKLKRGEFGFRDIFSKFVNQKTNSFNNLKEINENSIPFIIKYNSFVASELYSSRCDYFVYFTNSLSEYFGFLLGLRIDEKGNYAPSSLLPVKDLNHLKHFIGDQQLIIPTDVTLIKNNDYSDYYIYENSEKKINELKAELEKNFILKKPRKIDLTAYYKNIIEMQKEEIIGLKHELEIALKLADEIKKESEENIHSILNDYYHEHNELKEIKNHPYSFVLKLMFRKK